MEYIQIINTIADLLKNFDAEKPTHKAFRPGIGPFGDNGKEAENWTVNMLHPYPGNVSLISDAIKLIQLGGYTNKGLFVIGFEHMPARISLDPLINSFESITKNVLQVNLGKRIEERREGLVHPEHQVLRCIGWEIGKMQQSK